MKDAIGGLEVEELLQDLKPIAVHDWKNNEDRKPWTHTGEEGTPGDAILQNLALKLFNSATYFRLHHI